MPIYDYRCDHCGHAFSAVQSFSDTAVEKCPSCGKRPRKLLAQPAIVFKGSGWYKTDSRASAKPAKGTDATSDGASDAKSDKPAEKKADAPSGASKDAAKDTAKGTAKESAS